MPEAIPSDAVDLVTLGLNTATLRRLLKGVMICNSFLSEALEEATGADPHKLLSELAEMQKDEEKEKLLLQAINFYNEVISMWDKIDPKNQTDNRHAFL